MTFEQLIVRTSSSFSRCRNELALNKNESSSRDFTLSSAVVGKSELKTIKLIQINHKIFTTTEIAFKFESLCSYEHQKSHNRVNFKILK